MSIFTKLKTATDFSASVIKEGFALIWPEKKSDGSVALQVKLEDGSVQEIGGGSDIDTNAMVRIYDATVDAETGVITITDGTQVADLVIGDEIRTPEGVYQKVKDDITTGSIPDDGSHILVSGCTDPTAVNGMYVATGEPNIWKNETGNYWISKLDGYGGPWWFIASSQSPSNPGDTSICYRAMAATAQNPWDANFTPSNAVGALSVQKYSDLVSKTDTIDLFEYATFPEDGAKTSDITDDIATHNTSLDTHPMQGATTNDYNGLDTNCSWYLSYGDNTSNVNAPANGPFFVMTKKWTNSSGTAGAGMQIAIRNMTGGLVNQSVYIRTWSLSSGWRTWQKVGSSAMAGMPNYSAGVYITNAITPVDGSYTCPSAGWILIKNLAPSITFYINGENLSPIGEGSMIPVSVNDVITTSGYVQGYSISVLFYPNR